MRLADDVHIDSCFQLSLIAWRLALRSVHLSGGIRTHSGNVRDSTSERSGTNPWGSTVCTHAGPGQPQRNTRRQAQSEEEFVPQIAGAVALPLTAGDLDRTLAAL